MKSFMLENMERYISVILQKEQINFIWTTVLVNALSRII